MNKRSGEVVALEASSHDSIIGEFAFDVVFMGFKDVAEPCVIVYRELS